MKTTQNSYWLSAFVLLILILLITLQIYVHYTATTPIYNFIAFFISVSTIIYIAWFVNNPRNAILTMFFIIAISPGMPWPIGTFIPQIRIIFAILGLIYGLFFNKLGFPKLNNLYVKLILGYFLLLMACLPLSRVPIYGREKIISFLILIVIPIIIFFVMSPMQEKDLKLLITICILISVFHSLRPIFYGTYSDPRGLSEFLLSPITYSRYAGLGTVILFTLLVSKSLNILKMSLISLLLIFLTFALFITGSRGPIISILFSIIVVLIINFKRKELTFILTIRKIAIVILLLVICIYIVPFNFNETRGFKRIFSYSYNTINLDAFSPIRSEFIKIAFKGFLDSNFIGIGTGGFPSLLNRQDKSYPHNLILEILVEQGIVGFILICLLFLLTLRRVSRIISSHTFTKSHEIIIVVWFYSLINSMFSYDINGNYMVWIFGAFIWLLPFKKESNLSG
jgi:O-antigen ligase